MKNILLTILSLFVAVSMFSQAGTDAMLFGDVKSSSTGEHLPYVTISVKGTTMGTVSDGSGHFKIGNLPIGKCILVAQAVGFKATEIEVLMERGKATDVFIELDEDVLNLAQVVVTATRSEHFIKDVPVRTEVITAKAIENKNACNLYQALEGTPGVRVENQCQNCNFTMIRMQGLGAEHTQVLINGQPMYSGLAGVYGLQQLSTVDIDKIEVVKGAGSALYGSGAVAGAVNIVTKEPSFVPSTMLDAQIGSFATNKFDVNSSLRNEKGNIGLNIFAQRYTEGVIDKTGPGISKDAVNKPDGISDRVSTNLTNAGFGLYVTNAFLNNDKLVIHGKSVFEQRQGGTLTDDMYRNPFTTGTESIVTDRYEGSLSYTKKLGFESEMNFLFAFVSHNRDATNDSYLNDYMGTHNDSAPDLRSMRPYLANEHSVTGTLSFTTKLNNHSLIVGAQSFFDAIDETGMYVVVDKASPYLGQSYASMAEKSARELGMFVQDEWSVTEKLMIVPGLRVDLHHSGETYTANKQVFASSNFPKTSFDDAALNPRLAVKYELNEQFTLRANAGTGFRAPYGFSEDLHLCSGSPRVWKSSELKPETSFSVNLSADYYGKKVRVSTNIFRTILNDKIGFTDADVNVSALGYDYQWKNIDDAFVQGIELSVMANLSENLDLGLDLTYNQGEYKNAREDWIGTEYERQSKYISRFPATTGNLKIEYSPKTWTLAVTGNYQGSMYIDYYNQAIDPKVGDVSKIKKTDAFMLVNARVAKRLHQFKLYAGINNLLNYVQTERHLDDAAFMYAPVYGTLLYAGISIEIKH